MDKIYIESLKEIYKHPFPIGTGTTAKCYMGKDGNVIKIYKSNYDANFLLRTDDYIDKLERICDLSSDIIIGPKVLLFLNNRLAGYIYEHIDGKDLEDVSSNTRISELFKDYHRVVKELMRISSEGFLLQDVHAKNIIFNDNKYKFIDLDRGKFPETMSFEQIYQSNFKNYIEALFSAIYGLKPWHIGEFKDIDINNYKYFYLIENNDYDKLIEEYSNVCGELNPTLKQIRKRTLKGKDVNDYKMFI